MNYSDMSDDELLKPSVPPTAPAADYAQMSDDELLKPQAAVAKEPSDPMPDVSPGITDYKAIGERAAQAAIARAAEEPKIERGTERRHRVTSGTQAAVYGTAPATEWYDANVVKSITDTQGRTAKVGDVVGIEGRAFRFTGDDESGNPLFRRLTEDEAKDVKPNIELSRDVFRRMRGEGRIKMDSSPMEQVRLGMLSETGREDLFGEGVIGQMQAAAHRAVPYVGRYLRDKYVGQIRSLSELRDGNIDGEWRRYLSDDIRTGKLDRAKFGERRTDETDEQFRERLRLSADEELRRRVAAMQEATEEIGATERDAVDLVVGGFIDSSGYALEFAVPGGLYGKALKGAKLVKGANGVARTLDGVLKAEAIAAPVMAAEATSRYMENTTPGFEMLDDGTLHLRYAADSKGEAALKAIGGAIYDTNVEMGLEPLAMGMIRRVMRPAGWALGKMTPHAVREMGEKAFSEFMGSGLGRDLGAAWRAYQHFADITQIHSPAGEMAEEYVQAFEKVMNLDGRSSEYGGFINEWNKFCDTQHSWNTQMETFLSLVGQLAIGSGVSAYGAVKNRNDNAEVWRDIYGKLKRSGISDDSIELLTDKQRNVLTDLWRRYSGNPEKLQSLANGLGYAMRTAADELTGRQNLKFAETLEKMGLEPVTFTVSRNANGGLDFKHIKRFKTPEEAVEMDAMVDAEHGVTICDNKDGTYSVMNDLRGTVPTICPNFAQAYALGTKEARRNQLQDANNQKKAAYFEQYVFPNYSGRDFHLVDSVETLRLEMLNAIRDGGSYFGITDPSRVFGADGEMHERDAGAFHTPDGHTVLILDNVTSPNDMERLAAHEATGHEGLDRETGDTVAFVAETDAEGFSRYQDRVYRGRTLNYMANGYGEEEAQARAWEDVMSERGKRETMANYAMGRFHYPTARQVKQHEENERRRANGENVPTDDADLEVTLHRAEQEGRRGGGAVTRGQQTAFRDVEAVEDAESPAAAKPDGTGATEGTEDGETEVQKPEAQEEQEERSVGNTGEKAKQNLYRKFKVGYADVDKLVVNRRIEQFKEGADPVSGVVSGQRLKGPYREEAENPILVYVSKDGTQEIGSGRHRLDLAQQNGMKKILARFVYEEDGYTPEDVMVMDATSNIIDEKGTVKDYVKYFDRTSPTREEAAAEGLIDREKGRNAFGIFEGATDDTRQLIDWGETGKDGTISPKDAAIISEAAPKGENPRFGAVQRILTQKALGGLRGKKLGILARSLAEEAKNRKDAPQVGGEMQLDLFTSAEDQALLALEDKRAEYRVAKANEYGRIAEVLRTAVSKGGKLDLNAAYAQELGITDPKDKKQLVAARDKAIERANYWENAVALDATDRDAMDAEITAKSERSAAKIAEINAKVAAAKGVKVGEKTAKVDKQTPKSVQEVPKEEKKAPKVDKENNVEKPADGADGEKPTERIIEPHKEKMPFVERMNAGEVVSIEDENGNSIRFFRKRYVGTDKMLEEPRYTQVYKQAEDGTIRTGVPNQVIDGEKEVQNRIDQYLSEGWKEKAPEKQEGGGGSKTEAPTRTVTMKSAADEKAAKDALDAIDFDTDAFDPEKFGKLVTGVGKLVQVLSRNGYRDFKSLATYIHEQDAAKFAKARPALRAVWNTIAEQQDLEEVSKKDANAIYDALTAAPTSDSQAESPKDEAALSKEQRIGNAANDLVALLGKGEKFSRRDVERIVGKHLGGSVAEGTFTEKDASDILELAVNKFVLEKWSLFSASANVSPDQAVTVIQRIRDEILGIVPTQTVRTQEQIKMQQFSTPPHEAFCVNWVANIRPTDTALEPSAGIGGIAVFAKGAGAKGVIVNELSERRREILGQLGIADTIMGVDAAKIWAHLYPKVAKGEVQRPTVVVMNPPFSSSVVSGRHDTIGVGGGHIEAALDALAPGGRLVAVVGNGMSHDSTSMSAAAWWRKIGAKYRVMANVRVNGAEYAKYGTDFDNNVIVIDKVAPDATVKPVYGIIESLDAFPALMEGVRNARPISDQQTQQTSDKPAGGSGNAATAAGLAPVADAAAGERTGRHGTSAGVRGGDQRAPTGQAGAGVADGKRTSGAVGTRDALTPGANGSGQGRNTGGSDGINDGGDAGRDAGAERTGLLDVTELKSEKVDIDGQEVRTVGDGTFAEYKPSKLNIPGMKPHPGEIVESAAMASVMTPDITYSPKIPKHLLEKGQPSAAQLEVITLAGQAHEQVLPNGQRRGFFTQDGTGMGKGTEIGGVICDNFNHGRTKAIWISKNSDLFDDAKRDLSTYDLEKDVFRFGKGKPNGRIAFLSYDTLANNAAVNDRGEVSPTKGEACTFQHLVTWFGKDFDGVIVFDESHMMANVEGKKSDRGQGKGAKRAIIAVKLQEALPNARVLYATATAATEVSHLACLPRLGLWGEGTSFDNKSAFIDSISKGGLSMMEMVARDMKAAGLTLTRSLTLEGVVNRTLKHDLSPDQTRRYNECADAWQEVYDNILDTIAATGECHNGKAVGQIVGGMKTAQQRFFNSLLTSMMLPSVIPDMKRNLADGKSVVIQLTETNEAALTRAIENGKNSEDFDPEQIDVSPREILRSYVAKYFPTYVYTEVETEDGKRNWVIATGADGKPLQDPNAVMKRQELLDKIDMMKMDGSPMDAILAEFGYNNVAEVTGRSKRIERVDRDGEVKFEIVGRSKKKGEAEANEFNDGKRRILIFSEAGGTGKSYHASRTYKNQQQRVHYLLQAGWSAPPAIQGLGRTNRTNQASKPEYVLCTTDVKGHLRFISSVARRLQQMGSLTSGDRSTAGSGVFSEDQNIEDRYSESAIKNIFYDLYYNNRPEFDRLCNLFGFIRPRVDPKTGARTNKNSLLDPENGDLLTDKIPKVTDFLNTMLHLRIDEMNRLFDTFLDIRNRMIENAKLNGNYDPGLEKLIADKIVEKNRTVIYEDPSTGSKTELVELGVSRKSKKRSYDAVNALLDNARKVKRQAFFAVNKASGELYAFAERPYTETDAQGVVHASFYRFKPDGDHNIVKDYEVRTDANGNYTLVPDAKDAWTKEYDKVPDLIEANNYYVAGAILPVFGKLGIESPRVQRIEPENKKSSYLGLSIPNSQVDQVLANFGRGDAASANTPGAVYRRIVNDGKRVDLQHDGWQLVRTKLNGDHAIELTGLEGPDVGRRLADLGYGRFDRGPSGKPRFIIPRTEEAVAKFINAYPVKVDANVSFDSPAFDADADDRTFGFTNEDVAFELKAANLPVPKHVTKPDEQVMRQAETLLSNTAYMRKLAHAVSQKGRPTRDYENVALGIYVEQSNRALNAAKSAYDEMVREMNALPPDADPDVVDAMRKGAKELRKALVSAQRNFREAGFAKSQGASEQARGLRSNRFLIDGGDYSYAGLRGVIQRDVGTSDIPEQIDEEIGRLADDFKDFDARARQIAIDRLKAFSEKIVSDLKRGGKDAVRRGERAAGNELKRVTRNYDDAMTQVQVHADEAGGTLIGLADQLQPSWGKWLKAIGEYHCYLNPDITEQGVIDAIREDLGRYLDAGVSEEDVRDILTGFGHNFRQSRYDSQRKMNDLKAQALAKRQMDFMLENGKLPPQTGMIRDDASDERRKLRKNVQELKKDIDEQEGGPRALKGALASAKTSVRNQIADLERAIESGERIERSKRSLVEDAELQALKKRRDELRDEYDALFGAKSTLTDEQRIQRTEKVLKRSLERALERLARAQAGDFTKRSPVRLDSDATVALREEIANTNKLIRDIKDAAYPLGTPEEIERRNARRMQARMDAIQRLQARILKGDVRPAIREKPPMPKEMQERYDELGRQMKNAHRRLEQIRQEAKLATWFPWQRSAFGTWNFIAGAIASNKASYDRSAVGRQAIKLTAAHPALAKEDYVKAEKAAWDEEYFDRVNDEILSDPVVSEGCEKFGLKMRSTDIRHIHDVEVFQKANTIPPRWVSRLGEIMGDIPLLGSLGKKVYGYHATIKEGSERHYVTYLNLIVGQSYKLLVDAVPGGASDFQKRKFAGLINMLSGSAAMPNELRDAINKLNTGAGHIQGVIWSPSLWISQIQQKLMMDVLGAYVGSAEGTKDGASAFREANVVAKEALKLRVKATMALAAVGAMIGYGFGNDDWWDGLVADARNWRLWRVWDKLLHPVVGKSHIDLEMGERSFTKFGEALITRKIETSTGKNLMVGSFGTGDIYGLLGRYVGGKASPALSAIVHLLQGKDYIGNPYGWKELLAEPLPLSIGDVAQAAAEYSWTNGEAPVAIVMTLLGAGGNVYDDKYYERVVNPFVDAVKKIEKVSADPTLTPDERNARVRAIKESNGDLFGTDAKWKGAYGLVKQIASADAKVKNAVKEFETAKVAGKSFDERASEDKINDAVRTLDGLKRKAMNMIQEQEHPNILRPWRRQ